MKDALSLLEIIKSKCSRGMVCVSLPSGDSYTTHITCLVPASEREGLLAMLKDSQTQTQEMFYTIRVENLHFYECMFRRFQIKVDY
ncbi:hypothetical protein [Enterovibrio norvegicus]|uniref:hypothetical protein n=1 Tax=Enterovibrio norvegicus TaxID=188144 RepID=UPI00352C1437